MGGGGGGQNVTSTSVNYSPEEAAQRLKAMNEAERIYNMTAPIVGNAAYPGSQVVPYGAHTAAAMNSLWGYANNALPSIINNANSALNFNLNDVLYPESNPALQGYMSAAIRPITESYMDPGGVMSTIRTQAGQAGQAGGSRQGIAEGLAAGKYASSVGDTTSKIANEAYGQGLQAQGRALTLAPTYAQMGTLPSQLMGQIGSMFDTQQQQIEDYNAASRMWDLNAPWVPLQNFASIIYGGATPGTTTTGTGGVTGPSTGQKLAGAAMTGLGAYGAMTSGALAGTAIADAAPYIGPLIAALTLFGS